MAADLERRRALAVQGNAEWDRSFRTPLGRMASHLTKVKAPCSVANALNNEASALPATRKWGGGGEDV